MMTTPSIPRFLLACFLLIVIASGESMGADDPFRVESKPPTGGLVTRSTGYPPDDFLGSEMLRTLTGVLGELETRDFVTLRRALGKPIEASTPGNPLGVIHMTRVGSDPVSVVWSAHDDGRFSVRLLDDPDALSFELEPGVLDSMIRLPDPDPQLPTGDEENDLRFELASPYQASSITLDTKTRRARFRANYPDLTRELGNETMQVRFPRGFDPEKPSGILVWISPGEDGRPPRIFESVCDELGLICIGIDQNGNQRPLTDRLQIHLDSIETLGARYRIDRERVYLTGMSGGGRCSGILQCSFPEVFAGAVPIVGLDSYHNAPTGEGKKYWPARIGKPSPRWFKLLKDRRIAAITGSVDFNEPEMQIRRDLMTKDGLQVRLDIIEGMGHAMPTGEQFADALRWADEPRRDAIFENLNRAQDMLDAIQGSDPEDPKIRENLIEITKIAPWTAPAWEAVQMLGFEH